MKKKNIAFALILILIAVYLVVNKLGLIPKIPFFTIIFTILFCYTAVHSLMRLHFFETTLSLAIVGCINDKLLHIEAITPWTLLFASALIGIALDIIFKNCRKQKDICSFDSSEYSAFCTENGYNGAYVRIENSFGSANKYINSDAFHEASIENSFGECNVFFQNAVPASSTVSVRVSNTFGSTNLYLPSSWRAVTRQNTAFGNVKFRGHGSSAEDAPTIELTLDTSFGEINVIFE